MLSTTRLFQERNKRDRRITVVDSSHRRRSTLGQGCEKQWRLESSTVGPSRMVL